MARYTVGQKKSGTHSDYHYVTYHKRSGWAAVIVVDKKNVYRSAKSEMEAALLANQLLDEHGLHDRPRNKV